MPTSKTNIPTGDSKEDVYIRRAIIVERLYPLKGKSVPCGAFKGKKVEFVKIHELASALKGIGDVKIIVGERANKKIIHYCITKKKNN